MRRTLLALSIICAAVVSPKSSAEEYNIVIVTGQSNAKIEYAQGVMSRLAQSGIYDNLVLFHTRYSGSPLIRWVGGTPGAFYPEDILLVDFLATDWTPSLEKVFEDFERQGDTARVAAMFWFQGESDTVTQSYYGSYTSRFSWMIKQMWARYGRFEVVVTQIDSNAEHPEYLEETGIPQAAVERVRGAQQEVVEQHDLILVDSRHEPRDDVWHISDAEDPRGYYAPLVDFGQKQAGAFLERYGCPSDINNDRELDFSDVSLFLQSFAEGCLRGDEGPEEIQARAFRCVADLNLDGQLDFTDVSIFLEAFVGECPDLPNQNFRWDKPNFIDLGDRETPIADDRGS